MDEKTTARDDGRDLPRDLLARAERLGAARGLRRVQRDRERAWRLDETLRFTSFLWVVPVIGYAAVAAAFGLDWGAVVLVVALIVVNVLVGALRNPDGAVALLVALAGMAASWAVSGLFDAADEPVRGAAALTSFVLPMVTYLGVSASSRYVPRPWAYVLVGSLGALLVLPLASISPGLAVTVGIVWVLGVVTASYGLWAWLLVLRGRARSGVRVPELHHTHRARRGLDTAWNMDAEHVDAGAEAELRTAAHLLDLPEPWTVLHSREIPESKADIDHLAVGPTGVYLIDSKDWKGTIEETLVVLDDPDFPDPVKVPVLDGRIDRLPERVTPTLFEASNVARCMGLSPGDVQVVVALTDRTRIEHPMTLHLDDVYDAKSGTTRSASVHLMHSKDVPGWVQEQARWHAPKRGAFSRFVGRFRGGDPAARDEARDRNYVADLGALANHVLPPRP